MTWLTLIEVTIGRQGPQILCVTRIGNVYSKNIGFAALYIPRIKSLVLTKDFAALEGLTKCKI